jgi:hypothetical protein
VRLWLLPGSHLSSQLVSKADSGVYAVRQKAAAELETLRELAEPALRRALVLVFPSKFGGGSSFCFKS